ncbi:Acetyltransferase (GNAT) family protein [Paenibacillus sp. cl141a]|uniref:GNAT family N-acetyltransferase n=1 Tax=Paenibacillus sp. cl141a TaxID=1761877 RepID=UPI0008B0A88D|nr:GNAT family N-acetyltransferase [Paenibacillus sp. cl141a]SEL94262.1 Acetyltransferase (GNAT) family protein [Paenibacillus sp. cl141a]
MKEGHENIKIDVYQATEADSHIILDLWKGSARWIQSKGINQWNPSHFNINQVYECFNNGIEFYLAQLNEEVVGTLYICWSNPVPWGELDNNESGYIHRFAVSRNHTGNGIGKQLLNWAEKYIKDKGKTFIRLDCMAENARLNQYYLEVGYKHIRFLNWSNGWKINLYEKSKCEGISSTLQLTSFPRIGA